jgi:hypothetical protein
MVAKYKEKKNGNQGNEEEHQTIIQKPAHS